MKQIVSPPQNGSKPKSILTTRLAMSERYDAQVLQYLTRRPHTRQSRTVADALSTFSLEAADCYQIRYAFVRAFHLSVFSFADFQSNQVLAETGMVFA